MFLICYYLLEIYSPVTLEKFGLIKKDIGGINKIVLLTKSIKNRLGHDLACVKNISYHCVI